MNIYDSINNLVSAFKKSEDYVKYMELKQEIKKDPEACEKIKAFKEKQKEIQISYISGQEPTQEQKEAAEKLYADIVTNPQAVELLTCEMRINVVLADLQKAIGDAVEEIVNF